MQKKHGEDELCRDTICNTKIQDKIASALGVLSVLQRGSQNHRMVGVGRDLCGSSSKPPAEAGGYL